VIFVAFLQFNPLFRTKVARFVVEFERETSKVARREAEAKGAVEFEEENGCDQG
jgi:hypothetical protein